MNVYDFKDRVAIVTGGAQGIGRAVAERMLSCGGAVAIWDCNRAVLEAALTELEPKQATLGLAVDIGDLSDVEQATRATLERFGRIDILINNAAIVGSNISTWEYPPKEFDEVIHVGLTGTFYCSRTIVPHMIANNYGRIVNLSSIAGKEGNPTMVAYSSAKAGVIALTKSLGKELARYDIAVNAVTPGFCKTALSLQQTPEHIEYALAKIPRGRMLQTSEAASMICWLATAENSFTTGAVFDLSGGRATY